MLVRTTLLPQIILSEPNTFLKKLLQKRTRPDDGNGDELAQSKRQHLELEQKVKDLTEEVTTLKTDVAGKYFLLN